MDDLTGQTIGQYRLVRPLGEGGMAQVYQAYQPRLDRYVALKFIRPELAVEANFRSRFEQEARAIAKLSHGNIVHIYDFGEDGHRYYLVMEFVDGRTLKEYLQLLDKKDDWVTFSEAIKIIKQVASALEYAHKEGIVHRDVKPDNIMLTKKGRAVLNDFGIAKMIEDVDGGMTKTGTAIGTPAYMSPEQVQGQKEKLGPTSDLYSLGIILYELLIGKPPFTADTAFAVMLKHVNDPIPLPRQQNPGLSEAVERVLLKLLAKEPENRFETAAEFVEALEAAVAEGGNVERIENGGDVVEDVTRFDPVTSAPTVADPSVQTAVAATPVTQVSTPAETVVSPQPVGEAAESEGETAVSPRRARRWWLWGGIAAVVLFICALIAISQGGDGARLGANENVITFSAGGQVYRVLGEPDAEPQNLSARFDNFAEGEDAALNVSPNGEWFLLTTTRGDADCAGWACLVLIEREADEQAAEIVYLESGEVVHPEGQAMVNSSGDRIIYVGEGEVNVLDLWMIEREEEFWTEPVLLTAESPFAWNFEPSIDFDGEWVVFTCSDDPYATTDGHICEINVDDGRFYVAVAPEDGPVAFPEGENTLSSPDYAPGGDIVFTASWERTFVWMLPVDGEEVQPYGSDGRLEDDFVACVLPDRSVVTLRWVDELEGPQMVVTPEDGSESFVIDFPEAVDYGSVSCTG